jgi:hypothetical protein
MNHMMCPAVSDPFYGQWYRISAAIHQSIFVGIHGKLMTWVAQKYLPTSNVAMEKIVTATEANDDTTLNGDAVQTNGHAKEL